MNKDKLIQEIIESIRLVIGEKDALLHEPTFDEAEVRFLKECVDSTFVSSVGRFVNRFEEALEGFTGANHAIAVMNGTSALQISLLLADVKAGDEVIVPALSFVATANAVCYNGAIPHFVDIDSDTLGLSANYLRDHFKKVCVMHKGVCFNKNTNRPIKAIVPMHAFGHPVRLDELILLASEYNLIIIEDAAESLGSLYKGKHTGTFGTLGIVSFNGNKIITTGGGGAILTDNKALADRARHLTTTAKLPHKWEYRHDEIGYNFRMPNINAALGCAQMAKLDEFLSKKRQLFELYKEAFDGIHKVKVIKEPSECSSNYWLQTIKLDESVLEIRDELLEKTNKAGIMTRPTWTLLQDLVPFLNCPRSATPIAYNLSKRLINIPSSSFLS